MQLAIMTEPQLGGCYHDLLEVARWAEKAGCVSFARSDHIYWESDPARAATETFTTLAGLARDTSTIRLCVLVTPITFRHPAMIAKSAATIDEMSGGRMDLGVGTGWNDLEHRAFGLEFPEWKQRFARLEEALGYLRAAFGGGNFQGSYYSLDAEVLPRPNGLRLIIGGSGPTRTPNLAGRFADEYNHFAGEPAVFTEKLEVVRQAATKAGRPSPAFSSIGQIIVGRTKTEYRDRLERTAAARGRRPDEHERIVREAYLPTGSPEEVAARLAEYEAIGISKWYLQWFDLGDRRTLFDTAETILSMIG